MTRRAPDAHKYAAGHVALFAGSAGKTGAALMVAHAALRAGAGASTIVSWPEAASGFEARVTEIMTRRLDPGDIPASVDQALHGKRAVVIGPGFGLDDLASSAVDYVLAHWNGPTVIDADAITLLARGDLGKVRRGGETRIVTPHAGELARLLGRSSEEVEANRFNSVVTAAKQFGCIVLLKGAHSLVCNAAGDRVVVNVQGTPALATAGSGDVLSGIVGALACALSPFEAACAGAYLHATAGERWAKMHGDRGLLATEVSDLVPEVMKSLFDTPPPPPAHGPCLL
jgi:NAD(P)H-hydrate epimerase